MKRKIIKFLIIFTLSLPVLLFLHTGLLLDSPIKNVQVIFFTLSLGSSIVWPTFRKYILLLTIILIIGMVIFYILDIMYWANNLGSTAFGLVILVILSYFPELIKEGYIKKI